MVILKLDTFTEDQNNSVMSCCCVHLTQADLVTNKLWVVKLMQDHMIIFHKSHDHMVSVM